MEDNSELVTLKKNKKRKFKATFSYFPQHNGYKILVSSTSLKPRFYAAASLNFFIIFN